MDVSAVGRGSVMLDATGFTDLPGRFSMNGGTFQPLPGRPTTYHSASRRRVERDAERPGESDRARGRGRELDRLVRRAVPQERRLLRPHGRDRQRGARPVPGVAARADRARPDAPGHRRHRGLPAHPQELRRADPDADRARRGRRQDHRPRGRRRRLPDEAVQPARARRPREVDPAPRLPRAPRDRERSRSATATSRSTPAAARSASARRRSSSRRRSSTCSGSCSTTAASS